MTRIVALDSSILMILAGAHSPEANALDRVKDMIQFHLEQHETVAIPAVALAECCHCAPEVWDQLRVLSFNAPAAKIANRLHHDFKPLIAAKKATKREIRADAMILATAEEHGATILYTTDEWFDDVAKKHSLKVDVRPIPPLRGIQQVLPEPPVGAPEGAVPDAESSGE